MHAVFRVARACALLVMVPPARNTIGVLHDGSPEAEAPSLGERDFFLRKGIGWALREYSKTSPEAVRAYVAAHADRLSGLSKREALRLLPA